MKKIFILFLNTFYVNSMYQYQGINDGMSSMGMGGMDNTNSNNTDTKKLNNKSKYLIIGTIILSIGIIITGFLDYFFTDIIEDQKITTMLIGFFLLIINLIALFVKCCQKTCMLLFGSLGALLLGITMLLSSLLNLSFLSALFSNSLFQMIGSILSLVVSLGLIIASFFTKKNSSNNNKKNQESDPFNENSGKSNKSAYA